MNSVANNDDDALLSLIDADNLDEDSIHSQRNNVSKESNQKPIFFGGPLQRGKERQNV